MPDAGLSAGMGSEPTETMCVMRRSASALGEMAASILQEEEGVRRRGSMVEEVSGMKQCANEPQYSRAQEELALDDGVDVPPDHP